MGTVIATEGVEKEGTSGDSNTNAGWESDAGEFSAGESGRVRECGEHGKTVLEVCQAPSRMRCAKRQSMMRELPSEALWVLAHAAKRGRGR